MANSEDEDPESEFHKGERERDPMAFAKEYMRTLKKYLEKLGDLGKGSPPPQAPAARPVGVAAYADTFPSQVTVTVRRIKNGFLVQALGEIGEGTIEYTRDPAEVRLLVDQVLSAFTMTLQGSPVPLWTPPPEAGKGPPQGPPTGKAPGEPPFYGGAPPDKKWPSGT